jgi:hypothetical protein
MTDTSPEINYRVSRQGGWLMMMVALFLDFFPFIVFLGVGAVMLAYVQDSFMGTIAGQQFQHTQEFCSRATDQSLNAFQRGLARTECTLSGGVDAAIIGLASLLGAAVGWWLFPFIFFASAITASIVAFTLFPLWFGFGKRYNMLSFDHPGTVVTNVSSFIMTTILKWMPIINLFPLPVYWVTVWRHIQISRNQDRERFRKEQRTVDRARMRELMRRRRREGELRPREQQELKGLMEQQQYLPAEQFEFEA